jgi:hypothetical protein
MTTATKATRRSALIVGLISSAGTLGYTEAGSTGEVIAAASKLVPSNYLALIASDASDTDKARAKPFTEYVRDFGLEYQSAHVARYLELRSRSYGNRWGNYDVSQKIAAGREVLEKAEPSSEKANRRTELEQSAVKAAQNRWKYVKEQAGLKPMPLARPKTGANLAPAAGTAKEVPSGHVTMPKFTAPIDAVEFFDRLSREVLSGVNANALATPIAIKSAVQDFRKAIRAAVATAKAGAQRSAKAKATRGTVSAADVAAKQQRVAGGNGASTN